MFSLFAADNVCVALQAAHFEGASAAQQARGAACRAGRACTSGRTAFAPGGAPVPFWKLGRPPKGSRNEEPAHGVSKTPYMTNHKGIGRRVCEVVLKLFLRGEWDLEVILEGFLRVEFMVEFADRALIEQWRI